MNGHKTLWMGDIDNNTEESSIRNIFTGLSNYYSKNRLSD